MTGAVVSTTFTVRVTCVATFPEESEALYVTIYVPTVAASTVSPPTTTLTAVS